VASFVEIPLLSTQISRHPDQEVHVWTSDADHFQNLTGISLSKDTFMITFPWKSDQFSFRRYEPKCGKCNVKESFLKILDPDPTVDDFQNFTSFSLSTESYVDNFQNKNKNPISYITRSCWQTNRQTDKRTNAW